MLSSESVLTGTQDSDNGAIEDVIAQANDRTTKGAPAASGTACDEEGLVRGAWLCVAR
jgi:hypothetical protein